MSDGSRRLVAVGASGSGLFRSRSLPHLFASDSGVGVSGVGSFSDGHSGHSHSHSGGASAKLPGGLVAELRQLLTLKQHYYPEGGWGWVVVVCALFVQILAHGLHLGVGMLIWFSPVLKHSLRMTLD
ncbi:unnamed protein product [Bemisia tabaci]|uniref:Uncharacterized protein n=1 Tax=Bemisia tabaci TaxID=7038 RepID=A0A9P0AFU5_BEMTA|nr:unnamed protein product [Bemisia tabaci]